MATHSILKFPDPRLKQIAKPIAAITDELRTLANEMLQIMYDEPGIGLAAPQIGQSIRLAVVDTDWSDENSVRNPIVLINPEIILREGEIVWEEGCLSVPEFTADVKRAARVKVRCLDLDGNEVVHEAEGLRAVCFQHEIDHLDGVLFIDRISRLKRGIYVKKRMKTLKRETASDDTGPDFTHGATR